MNKKSNIKFKIITLIAFALILVGLIFLAFGGENVVIVKSLFNANLTKEEVQDTLSSLGWRGYLSFGILSMLQILLTVVPAEPIQVMAGVSFGLWKGVLICTAGIFVGNTVIYLLYRIYGNRLSEYFEKNAEFDFESASKSSKISLVIIVLSVLPAIPYGIICFFAAGLNLKYPKYILITTLSFIPSVFVDVGLGHIAIAASWTFSIIVLVVLIVLLILLYKYKAVLFKKVNEYVKKKSEPHSSKVKVRKPSAFVYNTTTLISRFLFNRKMKVTLKNTVGKLERPSIVLCNHGSFIDFVYAGQLLRKEKPNFVTARLYFYHKNLSKLLIKIGSFPKSMFSLDIGNAKNCMRVISEKGVIGMMPEARLSTAGKFEGIQDTTYKFIKRMNVPVYVIQIRGAYLAKPKWGDKLRKGSKVEATLLPCLKASEVASLSLEEIKTRVDEALYYNEFDWLASHPELKYKSKTLAVGLENILGLCPECGAQHQLRTEKRKIYCEKCGFTRELNERYGFNEPPFDNILSWYEYQKAEREKEIRNNPDFALTAKVKLRHASKDGKTMLRDAGEGVCILNKEGLRYVGTEDGENIDKLFPLADLYRVLFGAGEDFEVYAGEEIYFFVPENTRECVAWYYTSEALEKVYKS